MSDEQRMRLSPGDDRKQSSAVPVRCSEVARIDEIGVDRGAVRPGSGRRGEGSQETLAEPNFAAALRATDLAAAPLIEAAKTASRSHRRCCAEIAVAATKALLSFEEIPNWEDRARAELAQLDIKVNDSSIVRFRIVVRLVFRRITKVDQGDGDFADNTIGASQLTRYAQVMAWTYKKVKAGTGIDAMVDEICSLGGIRKVAELWVEEMEHRRTVAGLSAVESKPGELRNRGAAFPHEGLRVLGKLELGRAFREPKVSLTYPDGTVVEAPISAEQNSSWVAAWTSGTD